MISTQLNSFIADTKSKGTREKKDQARNQVKKDFFEFFKKNDIKKPVMLTLPSAWWKFEKEFSIFMLNRRSEFKINRFVFFGCEKDWKVFCLSSIKIPFRRNKTIKQKLNTEMNCQVVTNGDNHCLMNLDVFDYMEGNQITSNPKRFNGIWLDLTQPVDLFYHKLSSIESCSAENCIVVLTFLKARESNGMHKNRVEVVDREMNSMGFERVSKLEYMDRSPMIQLSYTRTTV